MKNDNKGKFPFFKILGVAVAVLFLGFVGIQYLEYRTQVEAIVSSEDEPKTVTFVDGSVAILAPNSTIKYNNYFNKKGRFVELVKGAANFSVVEEKGTFWVKTTREMITVLGTVFDVELSENQTNISVTEGKVNVRQNAIKQGQTVVKYLNLMAGESVVSTKNSLVKTKVENNQSVNYFEFQNSNLKTIITNLESVFDTNISVNPNIENCHLSITFENKNLEEILLLLEKSLNIKHQKIDGGFEISGESCE